MVALPPSYDATRVAAHTVAEHVLCTVRYIAVGRVGLTPAVDGVVTPEFATAFGVSRSVGLRGRELVDSVDGQERRVPLTTLRAAGEFFGIDPGAPALWTPSTARDADAPLVVHDDAMRALAAWFATVGEALAGFAPGVAPTLWPEHFDLAITAATSGGDATYGGSPGDSEQPAPYAYVVPPADPAPDGDREFWNARFGAALPHDAVTSAADVAALFGEAARRLGQ